MPRFSPLKLRVPNVLHMQGSRQPRRQCVSRQWVPAAPNPLGPKHSTAACRPKSIVATQAALGSCLAKNLWTTAASTPHETSFYPTSFIHAPHQLACPSRLKPIHVGLAASHPASRETGAQFGALVLECSSLTTAPPSCGPAEVTLRPHAFVGAAMHSLPLTAPAHAPPATSAIVFSGLRRAQGMELKGIIKNRLSKRGAEDRSACDGHSLAQPPSRTIAASAASL